MKNLQISILAVAFACAVFLMSGASAQAGGGKDKVDAAKAKGMPVFIDFGKTSCKPCQMMVPVLAELTKKYKGRMEVVFVHVDEEREYAQKMGAMMIPTQVLLDKDGKEVSRNVGYIPIEDCDKMIGKVVPAAAPKAGAPAKADALGKTDTTGKTCAKGSVCK